MPLEVKKRNQETVQSLVYRFQKAIRESGILVQARKIRFRERKKSEEMKKRAVIRKEEKKREYDKLKKLGKIE